MHRKGYEDSLDLLTGVLFIHVTSGHLRLHALERTFDLLAGSLLAFDKAVPHDLQALEDSAVLLMIAWPGREETRGA